MASILDIYTNLLVFFSVFYLKLETFIFLFFNSKYILYCIMVEEGAENGNQPGRRIKGVVFAVTLFCF